MELIVVLAIMGLIGSLAVLSSGRTPIAGTEVDSVQAIRRQAVRTGRAASLGRPRDLRAVLALPDGRLLRDSGELGDLDDR